MAKIFHHEGTKVTKKGHEEKVSLRAKRFGVRCANTALVSALLVTGRYYSGCGAAAPGGMKAAILAALQSAPRYWTL